MVKVRQQQQLKRPDDEEFDVGHAKTKSIIRATVRKNKSGKTESKPKKYNVFFAEVKLMQPFQTDTYGQNYN